MANSYFVQCFRRWGRKQRWITVVAVSDENPPPHPNLVAVYQVEASTRDEALGVCFEWLHLDRPKFITGVTEVTKRA